LDVSQKKILIVDDQIFNIDALRIVLEMVIQVDVDQVCDKALNGEEALKMVINNVEENNEEFCNYSLILMDCNMPFMDGYEATGKIRQYLFDKGILQPIIIGVTGHVEDVYIQRALNCGMNEVLFKPCDSQDLRQIVDMIGYSKKEIKEQTRLEGMLQPIDTIMIDFEENTYRVSGSDDTPR
jgi:CheY-like chemotaxis protein